MFKKLLLAIMIVTTTGLMGMSTIISISIFGADTIDIREERRVDYEPTKEEINNEKEKEDKIGNNDNEHKQPIIPTEKELKKFDKYVEGTKGSNDFTHLEHYNLSNAWFANAAEEQAFGDSIGDNEYVPQGLIIDNNGHLLISMYKSDSRPIVVRYAPGYGDGGTILNIYTLNDMDIASHVGGIGYYHKDTGEEFIFVSSKETSIRIYKIYSYLSMKTFIKERDVGHKTSTISTSYGYLWTAEYQENSNTYNELSGYKINFDNSNIYLGVSDNQLLVPNYNIKQPKGYIQGVYCDTNPEENKRLKFYFTASTFSYVYQAVVVTKDINNNGRIEEEEYYWESFYTPNEYADDVDDDIFERRLPLGIEGIVKKDDKLWVLNEGGEYCWAWILYHGASRVDCANEILVVDSIYMPTYPSGTQYNIFPSGEIQISGSGLQNWGYKVAIIYAQNKKGHLYYSIGQFDCDNNLCKLYLDEPSSENPIGAQYSNNENPKIFVEDVKGIYFMNLNQTGHPGDSDDFYMYNFSTIFDGNNSISQDDPYIEYLVINKSFGDDKTTRRTGDKEAMFLSFDFRFDHEYEENDDRGVSLYMNSYSSGYHYNKFLYEDIFLPLRGCYEYYGVNSHSQCRSEALWNMEDSIYYSSSWFLDLLNNYINRFYNIID